MNEVVKYNNDMNSVSFGGFKEKELDLFFSLCFKAKEQGTNIIKIDFSELKKLSDYTNRNLNRFVKDLDNTYTKMLSLNMKVYVDEWTFTRFNLFNEYTVNVEERTITIQVNEKFKHFLNNLLDKYTKFDLIDFVSLKSTYSKNLFKVLKQWENKKEKEFSLDEFKNLLGITGKYEKMSALDTYVLGQLRKELPEFFPNLKIEKKKTGRAVTSLKFTWGQKHQDINYIDDVEIQISTELQKAFEKASHNRFIQPFLTQDNKAELVEFFEDEKILIKGLLYAYKKIDKEFKRLSYLIKTIKTGAEQQTKTIKVVKKDKTDITIEDIQNDNIRQTSFDEIVPQPKAEEKERVLKEIYEDDFENLYKEYLKNNNADDTPYVRKCFAMPYKIIKREPKKEEKNLSPLEKIFTKDSKVDIVIKKGKKVIFDTSKIPEEMLLGKNGKKLVGVALQMRIKKIINDINKKEVK